MPLRLADMGFANNLIFWILQVMRCSENKTIKQLNVLSVHVFIKQRYLPLVVWPFNLLSCHFLHVKSGKSEMDRTLDVILWSKNN